MRHCHVMMFAHSACCRCPSDFHLLLLYMQWELIAGPDLLELLNEAHGRMMMFAHSALLLMCLCYTPTSAAVHAVGADCWPRPSGAAE
jgi:hypothetical protein